MEQKGPIFILGAHKSGSSLLRSLLDGHPDLFVLPFEAHFFQLAHYWVDYRSRSSRPPALSFTEAIEEYTRNVTHYNSTNDPTSDANLVGAFDIDRFKLDIENTPANCFSDLIVNYIKASYAALVGQKAPEDLRFVEKSVESAEFALDLKSLFPNAKFVHILRNPYSNLVAFRRHTGKSHYPVLASVLFSLNNSYYYLYKNQRLIDDYRVVRYEDLLTASEKVMREVADYLEIPFLDCLLQPTVLGKPWLGNSSRGLKFLGISPKNLDLWKEEINHLEKYYVNKYFSFILDDYGYSRTSIDRSYLFPVAREKVSTYLLNRSIYHFLR